MYKRHILGQRGEDITEKYLLENHYKIIERNFSCRQGEIDIIAKDGEEFVFIEVKTRTNKYYGNPVDAITCFKQKHILKSIAYYLFMNNLENEFIRIDIVEVYKKGGKFYIHHIKNAFSM